MLRRIPLAARSQGRTTHRTIPGLNRELVRCRRCPRLVRWRERVAREKVRRFQDEDYWGRPVTGFGDPEAELLLVGLAPAAHGANRTGRMFTGDESGRWLFRALHRAGFASHPTSTGRDDGLTLANCYVTAAVRCAPPGNRPTQAEFRRCMPYLLDEVRILKRVRVVVGLGRIGFTAAVDALRMTGRLELTTRPEFAHGICHRFETLTLIGSYHPSQQNTYTGTLTEQMFDGVFAQARAALGMGRARS